MHKLDLTLCSTDFSSSDDFDNVRKGLLAGYFMQVAHLDHSGNYSTAKGHHVWFLCTSFDLAFLFYASLFISNMVGVFILFVVQVVDVHPSSSLASRPALVIYNDFILASRNFIRVLTDVPLDWWDILTKSSYLLVKFDKEFAYFHQNVNYFLLHHWMMFYDPNIIRKINIFILISLTFVR